METIVERPAALDVHKAQVTACARVPDARGRREQHVAEFATTVRGLLALRDWLAGLGVTQVVMEATGVYWKAPWAILEDEFDCMLVNARHVKQVPGRKTDVSDAAWLCQLAEAGLLKANFVPPKPIRQLGNLTRYRKTQIQERAREVNRLHKALEDAGIKLDTVAADILGKSGRDMLDALVAGETDPQVLAEMARRQMRKKIPALRDALAGHVDAHHRLWIGAILRHIDFLDEQIEQLTGMIEEQIRPFSSAVELHWEPLVESVQRGEYEPPGADGVPRYLYSRARNVFVSDPNLVRQILQARTHTQPFMLIGEFGTGKNVFLELVAGGSQASSMESIDENVNGTQDEMLEKFFGAGGLIEQHPGSLLHFDLLQNALDWPVFMDKVHALARTDVLYRTDGHAIRRLGIRVVGGATTEIGDVLRHGGASSARYLYELLSTNQLARTKTLFQQRDRIETVLTEQLAARGLEATGDFGTEDIRALERLSASDLQQLQKYDWPDGFYELGRFVRASLIDRRWVVETLQVTPLARLKAFISYSFADHAAAKEVHEWLTAHNVDAWLSTEKLLPGQEWELEIATALHETDLVVVCLSNGSITKQGYVQTEIKRALDLVDRMPEGEIFLIPLRLEDCSPPFRMAKYQYVDFFRPAERAKLLAALRNRAASLGKAPVGSGRYGGA